MEWLNKKIGIVFLFFILSLMVVSLVYADWIKKNYRNLEISQLSYHALSARHAFEAQGKFLYDLSMQWSNWDATVQFMSDKDPAFIDAYFRNQALENVGVDLILFLDTNGKTFFQKALAQAPLREIPFPSEITNAIVENKLYFKDSHQKKPLFGVLQVDGRPLVLAARPILSTDSQGYVQGTLLTGQYITEKRLKELSERVNLPLKIFSYEIRKANNHYVKAESLQNGLKLDYFSSDVAIAFFDINNILGKPALVFSVQIPREIYAQSANLLFGQFIGLLFVMSVLCFALVMTLKRFILDRALSEHERIKIDLRSSQEKLQESQKLEAMGRLVGSVAHDFTDIWSEVLSYIEILKNQFAKDFLAFKKVNIIEKAALRGADLTRQLLDFSRKEISEKKQMSLNQAVVESVRLLRRALSEHVNVDVKNQDSLWPIKADATQMVQMIMNLIINARDAMPSGGDLFIQTQNILHGSSTLAILPCEGLAPGKYVLLSIRDTGSGISEEIQKKIFDKFFTTKPDDKGTGMGLSMVKEIVESHEGRIYLDSQQGSGTTFYVYFPIYDGEDVATQSGTELCTLAV